MEEAGDNRQMLIAYILGTMPEADRLALAERYLADDELFDQLIMVENDLLDQYVSGRLGPQERIRFERYLHRLPDGQHKIGVATALMKVVSEEQQAAQSNPDLRVHSRLVAAPRPQLARLYSLAAMLMVAMIGVIWLILHSNQLRQENARLRVRVAELAAEQQALQQDANSFRDQHAAQQARLELLQKDLENEQRRSQTQAQQIARMNALHSPLTVLGLSAASRDPSIPDLLHLPAGTRYFSLVAPVEGRKKYTGYHAVVQTTKGKLIWEKHSTRPRGIGKDISFRLASSQLPPASYKLTLILKTTDGTEIARDYYFTVVKP
jgi:anti-sigma factor RsiW